MEKNNSRIRRFFMEIKKVPETKICRECGEEKTIFEFEKGRRKCKACLYKQRQKSKRASKEDKPIDIEIEIPQTKEPDKKPLREKTTDNKYISENIKLLTMGIFGFISTRAGKHWELTVNEAQNLATPTTNIISRFLEMESVSKNMDIIMLTTSLTTIIIPRIIISKQISNKGSETHGTNIKRNGSNHNQEPSGTDAASSHNEAKIKTSSGKHYDINPDELYNETIMQTVF
jgi:hypothetical protein